MTTPARIRLALITLVCACVFTASYNHIYDVARAAANAPYVAALYPICIDAVILICALTLTIRVGVSKAARLYARLGRAFGFAATIFCNLAASDFTSTFRAVVCLIPAIALIFTVELLIHSAHGTAASRRKSARPPNVRPLRQAG